MHSGSPVRGPSMKRNSTSRRPSWRSALPGLGTGFFDNSPNHQVEFWGVYATRPVTKRFSMDAYYLGLDRKQATFERGTAHELRHTIGGRLWRPIASERPGWDFDYEGLWQFGVKADISSGDDPRTNTLGTFNPLFPMGNYFGVLATTGPGPINFIDIHPRVQTEFPRG